MLTEVPSGPFGARASGNSLVRNVACVGGTDHTRDTFEDRCLHGYVVLWLTVLRAGPPFSRGVTNSGGPNRLEGGVES